MIINGGRSQKMSKILLLYSTTDGHTIEICQRIQSLIEQGNHEIKVIPIVEHDVNELDTFDMIIIGASIRYGKHKPEVFDFIKQNQTLLDSKINAFFSVNVVARKPEKNTPETNPYFQKFLTQITWKPKNMAVFAGKIDYPSYTFFDRLMIRFIMWMTKGPTDPKGTFEFTDWAKVDEFGHMVTKL